ncbi:MAG: hypothetical protein R2688_00815 [Fimbriimonadaceae bacterium]
MKIFEGWWDRIKAAHVARGAKVLTFDPEYSPPNYMWTNPANGDPLAGLWDVCLWNRDQVKARLKD